MAAPSTTQRATTKPTTLKFSLFGTSFLAGAAWLAVVLGPSSDGPGDDPLASSTGAPSTGVSSSPSASLISGLGELAGPGR